MVAGLAPHCAARSNAYLVPGRAKNIVRQLGIIHGPGQHECPDQGGGRREGLLLALPRLQRRGHSTAQQPDHATYSGCETVSHATALSSHLTRQGREGATASRFVAMPR